MLGGQAERSAAGFGCDHRLVDALLGFTGFGPSKRFSPLGLLANARNRVMRDTARARHAQSGRAQRLRGGEIFGRGGDTLAGSVKPPLGLNQVFLNGCDKLGMAAALGPHASQRECDLKCQACYRHPRCRPHRLFPLIREPDPSGPYLAISSYRTHQFTHSIETSERPGGLERMNGMNEQDRLIESEPRAWERIHETPGWAETSLLLEHS